MKRKRYSVEQIVAILKQAEVGVPVAELIRQAEISEQTFYRWKKHCTPDWGKARVEGPISFAIIRAHTGSCLLA